jgi:amino-acid N-acetyltransferase
MGDHEMLRKATVADVPQILALVNGHAQRGEVLPRKAEEVYQGIREWVVAEEDGEIVGCGALAVMWADLAEVRSLVVKPEQRGNGLGARMVAWLVAEARTLGITQVFTLTRSVRFFEKQGFVISPKENFPRKIWKDCRRCSQLQHCDEVAMVLPLAGASAYPIEAVGTPGSVPWLEVAA